MPYSIETEDGITIDNIPDNIAPDSDVLKARVAALRAARNQPAEKSTTAAGVAGAVARGLAPIAGGAALGAAMGAPIVGVGAIPGAIAGAGAAGLATTIGDPVVNLINRVAGTKFGLPTEAVRDLLTRAGVPMPQTGVERVIEQTAGGAGGAAGMTALGMRMAQSAGRVTSGVGGLLAANPVAQAVGGAAAGGASQAAVEAGAALPVQLAASVAGGAVGTRLASPRLPPTPVPQVVRDAEAINVPIMTTDVIPPSSFVSKLGQSVGEKIPIVGIGPLRTNQQTARVTALEDLLDEYRVGGAKPSDAVMADFLKTKSKFLEKYVGMKRDVINKITERQRSAKAGEELIAQADDIMRAQDQSFNGYRLYSGDATANRMAAQQRPFVDEISNTRRRVEDLERRDLGWVGERGIEKAIDRVIPYEEALAEIQRMAATTRTMGVNMAKEASSPYVDVSLATRAIDGKIGELTSLRSEKLAPVIGVLTDWRNSLQNQSLGNVEKLRKLVGDAFKSADMASVKTVGEEALTSIYGPLREDMADFVKRNASKQDHNKWVIANKRLSESADLLDKTAYKSALDKGEVTPEIIDKLLFSTKPSDVKALASSLSPEGKQNAKQSILAAAVKDFEKLDPDEFVRKLSGMQPSIDAMFTPVEAKRLEGFMRVIKATHEAKAASTAPQTGVQTLPFVGGALLTDWLGGAGAATASAAGIGALARVYESKPVRDILLKVGQADKPEAQRRLVNKAVAIMQTQLQEDN